MTSHLEHALRWYDMGIPPIPLIYRSKKPKIQWKHLKETMPPKALLHKWFAPGLLNMAIILRDSLTVIDFDLVTKYDAWLMQHKLNTFTVKSNRGYHAYIRLDQPIDGNVACFDGGEVLGDGHIVLVPSSVHPSGNKYQVINDAPIAQVKSLADIGILILGPSAAGADPISTDIINVSTAHNHQVWLPTGGRRALGPTIDSAVDHIKARINICSLLGSSANGVHYVCCPFHDDRSPSLQVWPAENRCYCHSARCVAHKRIDVIDCAALLWGVDTSTAIGRLLGQCS